MDLDDDSQKPCMGPSRLRGPYAGTGHSSSTSTTYRTSTSSSFGTRSGVGISVGSSVGSSMPPQPLFGPPYHEAPLGTMNDGTFGSNTSTTTTTYGGSGLTTTTHHRQRFGDHDAFEKHSALMEREQRKFKIVAGTVVTLLLLFFFYNIFFGESSSSGWTIWIPLGPLWVGYGSEGFTWSFQFFF
ncbi:hypothetical protein FQN50_000464 [Emmonsiellopsis sp. PD_5]|nr:hypothetical protein FQN50_000464 [Emmonsiellopsis sp. PD_5]